MPKPKNQQLDFKGLEIIADEFTGSVSVAPAAITIAADVPSTLPGGDLQTVLESLAARIDALEPTP